MKRTGIAAFVVTLALATGLTLFNRCRGGDIATVTIEFGKESQISLFKPEHRLLNKIVSLFIANAYAIMGWQSDYESISLTVTGDGMAPITANIPPLASSYTIEVPSGSNRVFTVTTATTIGDVYTNWGGESTISLASAESATVSILMRPMTAIENISGFANPSVLWYSVTGAISYNVYRSIGDGPFIFISNPTSSSFIDLSATAIGTVYSYRISVVTASGEGLLCGAVSYVLPNP
jgi:hypothetical protein